MECPTSTYGPSSPALMSSVGRSAAACRPSGACVESSVQPCPARSYAQTRVVWATAGAMWLQDEENSPSPLCRTTVGVPEPVQFRWSRAVLPQIFRPWPARPAGRSQAGSVTPTRGNEHEDGRHHRLDDDDVRPSVGHRE